MTQEKTYKPSKEVVELLKKVHALTGKDVEQAIRKLIQAMILIRKESEQA